MILPRFWLSIIKSNIIIAGISAKMIRYMLVKPYEIKIIYYIVIVVVQNERGQEINSAADKTYNSWAYH